MNATGEFGPELRRRRSERGISLRDLAVQVHCDAGYLSRVERGLRQPSTIIARMCDRAVAADGALLALTTQPVPVGAAHARPELPAPRPATFLVRSFERAASGATVLTDDHQNTLNEARSLFQVLRAQGHVSAPSALLPALAIQFGSLRAAAAQAGGADRDRLVLLAAHYAEYAGWMIQECGDDAGALAMTELAAALAKQAGDVSFVSYTLLRRADVALYNDDGAAVIALVEEALAGSASLRVQALAAQRAAQGWALLGRAPQCRSALAWAADATAAADAESVQTGMDIALGPGGGGQLMDVVRGWCYLDLGVPEQAVESLHTGLRRAPRSARRARALYGIRLALAHAATGDLWRSCEAGTVALDEASRVDSASVRHQLHMLATVVRRWPGVADIRDFRIRIDHELRPSRINS
ncbi:helix-turn-helix transcriptional regulator [Micromonospora sp. NPDC006766]|uniref:helix-turn-helix domain-containing protein n=1 Tax=Micromonospora sp. NPDC006766 TaxID=3154778 RepID=UPI00340AAA07